MGEEVGVTPFGLDFLSFFPLTKSGLLLEVGLYMLRRDLALFQHKLGTSSQFFVTVH